MVRDYARTAGIEVDAEQFVRLNAANGWRDGKGQPIMSWRIWLSGYAARTSACAQARAVPAAMDYPQRRYADGELEHLFDKMQKYDREEDAE